jgi:hypothetical protein
MEYSGTPDDFSGNLVEKIFGKNAGKKFKQKGTRSLIPEIKHDLMQFIYEDMNLSSGDNLKKSNDTPDTSQLIIQEKENTNLMNDPNVNYSNDTLDMDINIKELEILFKKNLKNSHSETQINSNKKISKEITGRYLPYFQKLNNIYKVDKKYIDHWIWLFKVKGDQHQDFVSFNQLLCEVYGIHKEGQQMDEQPMRQGK